MIRLGFIRNPHSALNRGKPRPALPKLAEPASTAELTDWLTAFRDDDIELLVIDGGDGTVREVVTALAALRWGPRLAILPSGKINLVAGDVGWPAGAVPRLLAAAERGWDAFAIDRRPLMRLDRTGHSPVFGTFAGAAAFTAGWHLANDHLHPRGLTSGPAIAAALVLMLARSRGKLGHGVPMTVTVDGEAPRDGRHFLFLATTLERLSLGLWPFWETGFGSLRLLDIEAPPRDLLAALPALVRGRDKPWMRERGYFSTNATGVTLTLTSPVVLDGELFEPGPGNLIRLSAGPMMEFARP